MMKQDADLTGGAGPKWDQMDRITKLLSTLRVSNVASEAELCEAIAKKLEEEKISYSREVKIAKWSRVDFLTDLGIVIEVKKGKPSAGDVRAQLWRYAESRLIRGIILVVERCVQNVPSEANGKPIAYIGVHRLHGVAI